MGSLSLSVVAFAVLTMCAALSCASTRGDAPAACRYARMPALEAPQAARFRFDGFIGQRLKANRDHWLLTAPSANPAMIEMFRDREKAPPRDLLPWSGEFVGKYLSSAVLNWRITRDAALKRVIDRVIADFIASQSPEGYLGPFPKEQRLTVGWDLWGHYHALVGLLLYYDATHSELALAAAAKAGDFICAAFPKGGRRVVSVGSEEMNEAIIHGLLLLYERTGEKSYLDLARRVEQDWETPPSGDYVRSALAGVPFYRTPKPRWESLHDLQAIAELYFLTGDAKYRRAFEHIWSSIRDADRHNTGGFSSGEQACGDPYSTGAIETCCTVAWIALSLDMLRLTGDSTAADEIELATFNAGIGGQSPSGRWWTYNTPMEGEKKASAHDISFQCRPASPELNCCAVNGPRILGMLSQWSLMTAADGLALNYYGPGELSAQMSGGAAVTLRQEAAYPRDGEVLIRVGLKRPQRFGLRLRIPAWSAATQVRVNGKRVACRSGSYLVLTRAWKDGDRIGLSLDMSPHFWAGEKGFEGKASIYRGPILLAYDPRFNLTPFDQLAAVRGADMRLRAVARAQWPQPWLLLEAAAANGAPVLLCDFATAGMTGTRYHTWLRADALDPARQYFRLPAAHRPPAR